MKIDSIIFDMDGVLVDVSKSYRLVIKKTVEYVLKYIYGIQTSIKPKNIEEMKQKIVGFNNDWDLSFEIIRLFLNRIPIIEFSKKARIVKIQNSREYQLVKDIFQNYYLGNKLFYKIYKRKSPVNFPKGLIRNETLLIDREILKSLSNTYVLGVATSRPRFEALFALRNLNITPGIIKEEYIVAQEDAPDEKPSPDPLIIAKKKMKMKKPVYVGDTINDTISAKKANMPCIFVGKGKLGNMQISDVNNLKEILL